MKSARFSLTVAWHNPAPLSKPSPLNPHDNIGNDTRCGVSTFGGPSPINVIMWGCGGGGPLEVVQDFARQQYPRFLRKCFNVCRRTEGSFNGPFDLLSFGKKLFSQGSGILWFPARGPSNPVGPMREHVFLARSQLLSRIRADVRRCFCLRLVFFAKASQNIFQRVRSDQLAHIPSFCSKG